MLGRKLARTSMIKEMPQSQPLQTRNIFSENFYKARETKLLFPNCVVFTMAFQKCFQNKNQCRSWVFFFQKLVGQDHYKKQSYCSSVSHVKLNEIKMSLNTVTDKFSNLAQVEILKKPWLPILAAAQKKISFCGWGITQVRKKAPKSRFPKLYHF